MGIWINVMNDDEMTIKQKLYLTYCFIELRILALLNGGIKDVRIEKIEEK